MSSLPSSSHLQNPTPTLTLQQQAGYLDRIGTTHSATSIKHDRDTLTLLTTLHITHIPFENLLIHRSLPYSLFVEHLYHKIVTLRQGGFCFELNGLFGCLLHSVGFSVRFVETCVNRGQHEDIMRGWDPWTHLLLIVTLQDQHYAVDVGFGTPPLQPLVISPRLEQTLSDGFKYRVTTSRPEFHTIDYAPLDYHPASDGGRVNHTDTVDQTADDYLLFERWSVPKQAWVPRIMIHARLQNRVFPEYFLSALERVLHPTSIFRAAVLVCLIPRAHVLWTVSGLRLLESVTPYGERVETTLDENQAMEVLKDRFGIDFAKDEYAGTNPIHFGRGGVGYEPPKSTPTTAAETATVPPTAPTTATQ